MTVLNLSFCAAGFLGIYHLGAAKAFLRHGDKLLGLLKAYAGASAGALIASLMVTAPDKLEVGLLFFFPHSPTRNKYMHFQSDAVGKKSWVLESLEGQMVRTRSILFVSRLTTKITLVVSCHIIKLTTMTSHGQPFARLKAQSAGSSNQMFSFNRKEIEGPTQSERPFHFFF